MSTPLERLRERDDWWRMGALVKQDIEALLDAFERQEAVIEEHHKDFAAIDKVLNDCKAGRIYDALTSGPVPGLGSDAATDPLATITLDADEAVFLRGVGRTLDKLDGWWIHWEPSEAAESATSKLRAAGLHGPDGVASVTGTL